MDATWIKEVGESMGAEVGEEEIIKRVGVSRSKTSDWKETELERSRKG